MTGSCMNTNRCPCGDCCPYWRCFEECLAGIPTTLPELECGCGESTGRCGCGNTTNHCGCIQPRSGCGCGNTSGGCGRPWFI